MRSCRENLKHIEFPEAIFTYPGLVLFFPLEVSTRSRTRTCSSSPTILELEASWEL